MAAYIIFPIFSSVPLTQINLDPPVNSTDCVSVTKPHTQFNNMCPWHVHTIDCASVSEWNQLYAHALDTDYWILYKVFFTSYKFLSLQKVFLL